MEDLAMTRTRGPYHPDDIVAWPDGSWATVGEVENGHYNWKSDDYEVVRLDDVKRLKALGLGDELDTD
jgi:hypothetical protein